jgi:hypothetical protein
MYENNPFAAFGAGFFITCGILGIIELIALWKIYTKAEQPGWACIIPIYSFYVMLKIIGKPWWWLLLLLIPGVNIVIAIWSINLLSKSFGNGVGFTLGLLFLGFIFYPILGFGSARYIGPVGDPLAFQTYQDKQHQFGQQ